MGCVAMIGRRLARGCINPCAGAEPLLPVIKPVVGCPTMHRIPDQVHYQTALPALSFICVFQASSTSFVTAAGMAT